MSSEASNTKPRILWVNPLGYKEYDQPMADFIDSIRTPGFVTDVVSFDMSPSPAHLEYRTYEALVTGDIVRIARHAGVSGYDAMVIGCFYDPGLEDAMEISGGCTVLAPCQASLDLAARLSNRFSIIVGQQKWVEQMTERVSVYGYAKKLASMPSIDIPVPELQADCQYTEDRIIEAGRLAVERDQAEALILGCTCTFGLYERVQRELGVPVIDPIVASYRAAEHMAALKVQFNWSTSRVGSLRPPPEAELEAFGIFKAPAPIGNTIQLNR